ncbi:MAG TPA: hypothetical protein PLY87_10015 [Planctomycetaceae bacterium]|nr:hypothetical protein [Planctomycetaceae bacterium]HQZ65402.1 hypothetical protein [Planctomycetaceae bacterium]
MATVTHDAKGARVWFKDAAGARKSIRLGDAHIDYANRFALYVEDLNTAVKYNATLRPETAQWVVGLCDDLQNRLAALGLIEIEQAEPEPAAPTLASFIDEWVTSRHDVKPATHKVYGRTRHFLTEYFGDERRLDSITAGDADEWALFIRTKLNENTSRKHAAIAKLMFKRAKRNWRTLSQRTWFAPGWGIPQWLPTAITCELRTVISNRPLVVRRVVQMAPKWCKTGSDKLRQLDTVTRDGNSLKPLFLQQNQ